jgi:hypothetical protein
LLAALVIGAVVVGLLVGLDVIRGMTYSRFRPVYVAHEAGRGTGIWQQPISAAYQEMIEQVLIDRAVPYEMRDGALYVRNLEWSDKYLMADITLSTAHPSWPRDAEFLHGVKLLPLYPERSVLAQTALFREWPADYAMEGLDCVFHYYGLQFLRSTGYVLVPEPVLHNAAFLRFAAARANDSDWLADKRSRGRKCETGTQELSLTSDGESARPTLAALQRGRAGSNSRGLRLPLVSLKYGAGLSPDHHRRHLSRARGLDASGQWLRGGTRRGKPSFTGRRR